MLQTILSCGKRFLILIVFSAGTIELIRESLFLRVPVIFKNFLCYTAARLFRIFLAPVCFVVASSLFSDQLVMSSALASVEAPPRPKCLATLLCVFFFYW